MNTNDMLKKKYTKKQLRKYFSKQRSTVGMNKNLSQVSFKSEKDYDRNQIKLYLKNEVYKDE